MRIGTRTHKQKRKRFSEHAPAYSHCRIVKSNPSVLLLCLLSTVLLLLSKEEGQEVVEEEEESENSGFCFFVRNDDSNRSCGCIVQADVFVASSQHQRGRRRSTTISESIVLAIVFVIAQF